MLASRVLTIIKMAKNIDSENKKIALAFFTTANSGEWLCGVCDTLKKAKVGSGWTNLASHVRTNHPEELNQWKQEAGPSGSNQTTLFGCMNGVEPVSKTAKTIASWIDWVVNDDQPFSFVDRKRTKKYTSLDPVCRQTLRKYMLLLVEEVRKMLKGMLPAKYGLAFDGWSLDSEHYLAVFALWTDSTDCVQKRLLSCYVQDDIEGLEYLPDVDDAEKVFGLTAEDQFDCLVDCLMNYGATAEQCKKENMRNLVQFCVGDNCSTNIKMARLAEIPFVGCKSHLLNLDVQAYIGEEERVGKKRSRPADPMRVLVNKVDRLSGKLRTIKNAAILRSGDIDTTPQRKNATRWSSTFQCLLNGLAIIPHLSKLDFGRSQREICELTPSAVELEHLKELIAELRRFESVSKALQRDELTLLQAHGVLDRLRRDCNQPLLHIIPTYADSPTYHLNYHFEQGIIKVQRGAESELSYDERNAITCFLKSGQAPDSSSVDQSLSYADAILFDIEESSSKKQSLYESTAHALPTSNLVERLFSMAQRTMTAHRKNMGPEALEATLILRCNRDLWEPRAAAIIHQIMKVEKQANAAKKAAPLTPSSTVTSDLTLDDIDDDDSI